MTNVTDTEMFQCGLVCEQLCSEMGTFFIVVHPKLLQGQRSGIVIPVGSSQVHPSPASVHQNIQIKPVSKPTIHIKQEGGTYWWGFIQNI